MDLISNKSSWDIIENKIKERAYNVEKTDYLSIKNKLLDCDVGPIVYIDNFTPLTDDLSFLFSSKNEQQTVVFLNSLNTIGDGSIGRQGIALSTRWKIVFKIPAELITTNLHFSMNHIGLTEGNIVVPIGTKQDYINLFNTFHDYNHQWGSLTQEEKEAIVVEGDEYEIIG